MPHGFRRSVEQVRSARGRLSVRMVAGMLAVSLPITIALTVALDHKSSGSLINDSSQSAEQLATALTLNIEGYVSERQQNLDVVATQASARPDDPSVAALVNSTARTYDDYSVVE